MSRLPYVVECNYATAVFEPIAAFNSADVAEKYAVDCQREALEGYRYRLIRRHRSVDLMRSPLEIESMAADIGRVYSGYGTRSIKDWTA